MVTLYFGKMHSIAMVIAAITCASLLKKTRKKCEKNELKSNYGIDILYESIKYGSDEESGRDHYIDNGAEGAKVKNSQAKGPDLDESLKKDLCRQGTIADKLHCVLFFLFDLPIDGVRLTALPGPIPFLIYINLIPIYETDK